MFFSRGGSNLNSYDIWMAWRAHIHDDFSWQPPEKLGPNVNSAAFDAAPHYFENEDVGFRSFSSPVPGRVAWQYRYL